MRPKVLSSPWVAPVATLVLIALVFVLAGNGGAAPRTLITLTGGPVQTPTYTDDDQVGNVEVTIPLNGASSYTFTQKAGEALLITAEAVMTSGSTANFCGAQVSVRGVADENVFPNSAGWLGLNMTQHTNKGDYGELTDSRAIPAPAANRSFNIEAVVVEGQRNDPGLAQLYGPGDTCDGFGPQAENPNDPDYDPFQDDWTASVRVTIVSFR
jgi:hypothetical protein